MAGQPRKKSKEFGLEEYTFEEIAALPVYKNSEEISEHREAVCCEGIPIKLYDSRSRILQSDLDLVKIQLGKEPKIQYVTLTFKQAPDWKIPSGYIKLAELAETWSAPQANQTFSRPRPNQEGFFSVISLFLSYPSFGALYESYVVEPDDGVALTKDLPPATGRPDFTSPPSTNDVKITCHLMLLLMSKSFASDENVRRNQAKTYWTNRVKAVKAALKMTSGECLFEASDVVLIAEMWERLPRLRKTIFIWSTIRGAPTEFTTAHLLMHETQMVTISCMSKFIDSPIKSKAHAEPTIWAEVANFLDRTKEIRDKLGGKWPYYRIIMPSDKSLANANFPNLAKASVIFAKTHLDNAENFANVVTPTTKSMPGLEKLAKEIDDSGFYSGGGQTVELTELQKAGAAALKIDLAQYEMTKAGRKTLQPESDIVSDIEELLRRKRS